MDSTLEFGIVGLGHIGGGLAEQALGKGLRVVGFDTDGAGEQLIENDLVEAKSLAELCRLLDPPRIIFLYIPAGPVVDEVIEDFASELAAGDIIVDGGNSYWGDSLRRYQRLAKENIPFINLDTSGGIPGACEGACFMAGGDSAAVSQVEPILRMLAIEGGYVHTGPPGTGHFVKLVHNGIEFGMLQAIGEGVSLLEAYPEPLDLSSILHCWNHGSVIRSWLVELMEQQYSEQEGLGNVPPYVEDTGEVNWLVADAMNWELQIPVIAASVMQLFASRDERKDWARAVAMMRHGFGGHPFGRDQHIKEEREIGRVGPLSS